MKLSEFIGLSDDQKRAAVHTQGVAVAKREIAGQMAFLFQLSGYYVETLCSSHNQEIEEYYVFQDTRQLAPYLETIAIDDLIA